MINDPEKTDALCKSVFEKHPELVSRKTLKDVKHLVDLVSEEAKKAAPMKLIMERVCKNLGFEGPLDFTQLNKRKKKKK